MDFSELLNSYIEQLSITQGRLADSTGLSKATISRYCSGKREPLYASDEIKSLASGISDLAVKNNVAGLSAGDVEAELNDSLKSGSGIDYDSFIFNLKQLMSQFDIKRGELARGIYSDPSYISKILSGTRKPGDTDKFADEVATYTANRFAGSDSAGTIMQLTGVEVDPNSASELKDALLKWFGSSHSSGAETLMPDFLNTLSRFDLADYMKQVHFDDIKIPPAIPHLSTRKEYTGIERMMEAEIEFMKTTVLSKSDEPCILYSDMPLEEMASDPDFPGKYMLGMALMLKRGLRLNFIHDVDRPFSEMMLGLKANIPLYMTGQISPYYLPGHRSSSFNHFLKVSGSAALEGSAIAGNQAGGKYTLYRSKDDIAHYRKRAEDLLAHARPLMDIFRSEKILGFDKIINKVFGSRDIKLLCSNIPAYLLSEALLDSVLAENGFSEADAKSIRSYRSRLRALLDKALTQGKVHVVIPLLSRQEFEVSPISVSLADLFMEKECQLSYEDYVSCRDELMTFAANETGLSIDFSPSSQFSNINISISGDDMVVVSKEKSPAIHFAIYHKRMIRAFKSLSL